MRAVLCQNRKHILGCSLNHKRALALHAIKIWNSKEVWNETLFPSDMKFSGQNETLCSARARCRIMHAFFIQSPKNHFIKTPPPRIAMPVHCARVEFVMVFSARQPKSRKGFIIYEIDLEFMRFKVSLSLICHGVHRALAAAAAAVDILI